MLELFDAYLIREHDVIIMRFASNMFIILIPTPPDMTWAL